MANSNTNTITIAKTEDGTIQLSFTIPFNEIKEQRQKALEELAKNIEVPGFRKGNAPLSKVSEKISKNELTEKTLSRLLPQLFSEAIEKNKIKPAIYPRFELIKADEETDWQVRAFTCELPLFELGDYKATIKSSSKNNAIWTPDTATKTAKEPTKEEKEQVILKTLLESVKIEFPKILIDEEVNEKLANLLQRIEKLGLNLDSYLASLGKTPQSLRSEYETQVKESLSLELILDKIAKEENITVKEEDVNKTLEVIAADPNIKNNTDNSAQRKLVETVLKRRDVIEKLSLL